MTKHIEDKGMIAGKTITLDDTSEDIGKKSFTLSYLIYVEH